MHFKNVMEIHNGWKNLSIILHEYEKTSRFFKGHAPPPKNYLTGAIKKILITGTC